MSHPYEHLSPDLVLDAVQALGLWPDGHLMALNSYENRVFQVGIDERPPLVAKFYRPDRWSDAQIAEEHAFSAALAAGEIPVVPPLAFDGHTLHEHGGFRFALFDRRGGREPELHDPDQLEWVGRFIGRIHMLGAAAPYTHRPTLDMDSFGWNARARVLASGHLPADLAGRYAAISQEVLETTGRAMQATPARPIRLHGDCHRGNILWTDAGPHFVDLDDSRMGPAVQDLWMLLSGDRAEMTFQLSCLVDGYETFREFDRRELNLLEPLRTLRLVHYTAWLASRWQDPAFPQAFPWFAGRGYWEDHIADLEQQALRLEEPPLHA